MCRNSVPFLLIKAWKKRSQCARYFSTAQNEHICQDSWKLTFLFQCFLYLVLIFVLRKTFKKCVGPDDKSQRLRQLSQVSDKMLELGLPQETFQFMPLKALSPLSSSQGPDLSYEDKELPDYDQLQNRRIDPNKLWGATLQTLCLDSIATKYTWNPVCLSFTFTFNLNVLICSH